MNFFNGKTYDGFYHEQLFIDERMQSDKNFTFFCRKTSFPLNTFSQQLIDIPSIIFIKNYASLVAQW